MLRGGGGSSAACPGVAQLVARVLWERVRGGRGGEAAKAGKPLFYWGCGGLPFPRVFLRNTPTTTCLTTTVSAAKLNIRV